MMKSSVLAVVVALAVGISGTAMAGYTEGKSGFGGIMDCCTWELTVSSDFATKYMWHGLDVHSMNAGRNRDTTWSWQPSIDLYMVSTGLGVNIWGQAPIETYDGVSRLNEIDYKVYWRKMVMEQFEVSLSFTYLNLTHDNDFDTYEFQWGLAYPCGPVTLWYSGIATDFVKSNRGDGGTFQSVGADYVMPLPCFGLPCADQGLALILTADTNYQDGVFGARPGWGWSTFGIGTEINFVGGLTFAPALYYQVSHEDTYNWDVNKLFRDGVVTSKDELYGVLSLSYMLPIGG